MLISMNWIKDYVDLTGMDLEQLIQRFTLSTAEVEEIQYYGKETYGVVAGKIINIKPVEGKDKLKVVTVDLGEKTAECICGAPNVRVGMVVPYVGCGGSVKGNEIKTATIAGYESNGMCCSEFDIGISADHSGLMVLEGDIALGTDLKDLYGIEDTVFEVDNKSLTNRPDLWGHYGIAREFAALSGRPLKDLDLMDLAEFEALPGLEIENMEPDLAYRYSCIKVNHVHCKIAPVDMRIRLFYCGMRSINFLTDLTNYLMLELGQPMHAFDADIVKSIRLRRFPEPFQFTTLDNIKRDIDENVLMVCNGDVPVAIAGIMGGLDSDIEDSTTSLFLESANFDSVSVRKSTIRLGLRTDASTRYEKVLDPEMTKTAVKRFLYLLKESDKGIEIASRFTDNYSKKFECKTIYLDMAYINRYTGIEIAAEDIKRTLTALGFDVMSSGEDFKVTVPSWRATKDVTIKADVIEEITRIYGYDNFEIKSTMSLLTPVERPMDKKEEYAVKDILVNRYMLHEVHSYLWCDDHKFSRLGLDVEENISLINSINSGNDTIRNSLVPTLLCILDENKNYKTDFGIFEIGKVVEGMLPSEICNEKKKLAITLFSKSAKEQELFFYMRDLLTDLSLKVKHKSFDFVKASTMKHGWLHPENTFDILYDQTPIGYFSVLHPVNQQKIDQKASILLCQIDMEDWAGLQSYTIDFVEPSKYPGIEYDLSFVLKEDVLFKQILAECESLGCQYLKDVYVIDMYQEAQKSITFRMLFSSKEKTLNMAEIQDYIDKLIANLSKIGLELKK